MNTQEFLDKTGLANAPAVTYYIKKGVITPGPKVARSYSYTQENVDQYLAYKAGETPEQPENLKSSTPISETPEQTEESLLAEVIKGDSIEFTHNCWGEPFDTQCEPISPATYSVKTMRLFFKQWACHENDDLLEHLTAFCKKRFDTTIGELKDFFNFAVNNPWCGTFDKYFMPTFLEVGGEYKAAYSYDEAVARLAELKAARPFRPDWPDIETFTAAFLFHFSMSFYKTVPEFLAAQRAEPPFTDILQYEMFMKYVTREADTYPPRWHKTTMVYHGIGKDRPKGIPKALNADGSSRFPDKLEDMRYSRNIFKLPTPRMPSIKETLDMSGEVYIAAITRRKQIIAFKEYYGINDDDKV